MNIYIYLDGNYDTISECVFGKNWRDYMNEKKLFIYLCTMLVSVVLVGMLVWRTDFLTRNEKYVETGMKLNGHDILTFSDWYKETDEYNRFDSTCDFYVYDADYIEYYFTADNCQRQLYQIDDGNKTYDLNDYIYDEYPDVTVEELLVLDFIKTKPLSYIETNSTITTYKTFAIHSYTDAYYAENAHCMEEWEIILYEDEYYEYIYKFESCGKYPTAHFIRDTTWAGLFYTSIDKFVKENLNLLTWCDIEATGLGTKVLKTYTQ